MDTVMKHKKTSKPLTYIKINLSSRPPVPPFKKGDIDIDFSCILFFILSFYTIFEQLCDGFLLNTVPLGAKGSGF